MKFPKKSTKKRLAIDADSILYIACYRAQKENGYVDLVDSVDEFEGFLYDMLREIRADIGYATKLEYIIVFSPSKSFRNIIYPEYKAHRKRGKLDGIINLKNYIKENNKKSIEKKLIEADDVVIHLAHTEDYIIAAIDKDVINASPTPVYNYKKRLWFGGKDEYDIEKWYFAQALQGDDSDNIKGAYNIGYMKSTKWVNQFDYEAYDWEEYCELFGSEQDAIMNMQLVRMDQIEIVNGEYRIRLWMPQDSKWVGG